METKIIVELDKKQYHMLSRAILDDLYERKANDKDVSIVTDPKDSPAETDLKDVPNDLLFEVCITDDKTDITNMAS